MFRRPIETAKHGVRGEGMRTGLDAVLILIEVSKIVLQETDLPDLVVDFADAHELLTPAAPVFDQCRSLLAFASSTARPTPSGALWVYRFMYSRPASRSSRSRL